MNAALVAALVLAPSAPDLVALDRRLDQICDRLQGRMGYHLILLKDGRQIGHRENERFPTASTIKTAIALEAIRQVEEGRLKWTDKRAVPPLEGRQASMWSYHFKDNTALDVDGWTNLMIGVSDNTATMVLREWLTPEAVNRRMTDLGLPNTKVLWDRFEDPQMRRLRGQFGLGMTTPKEMATLLQLVYSRKAASPAGCDKLIRILSRQYWDDVIGISVPPDVRVASKSGAINRSRSDSGIVFGDVPYVLTVYTDSQKDQRWTADNEGDLLVQRLAREVWKATHPHRPYTPPSGYERFAPTGGGV